MREAGVTVDRDFVRVGNKSYAVGKINTVEVKAVKPYRQRSFLAWGALAALALTVLAGGADTPWKVICTALAAVFAVTAWRAYRRSKIVEFRLLLVTSSGAVQAFKSLDGPHIFGIRDQVEKAIADRS